MILSDKLRLNEFKCKIPKLSEKDNASIVGFWHVLSSAGIPKDAALERDLMECCILSLAKRISYCDYVDNCLSQCGEPVSYHDWVGVQ